MQSHDERNEEMQPHARTRARTHIQSPSHTHMYSHSHSHSHTLTLTHIHIHKATATHTFSATATHTHREREREGGREGGREREKQRERERGRRARKAYSSVPALRAAAPPTTKKLILAPYNVHNHPPIAGPRPYARWIAVDCSPISFALYCGTLLVMSAMNADDPAEDELIPAPNTNRIANSCGRLVTKPVPTDATAVIICPPIINGFRPIRSESLPAGMFMMRRDTAVVERISPTPLAPAMYIYKKHIYIYFLKK